MQTKQRKGAKRGRKPFHPWAEWIGKRRQHTVVLARGRDFRGAAEAMRSQLRAKAKELGWRISVLVQGDVLILTNLGRDNAAN